MTLRGWIGPAALLLALGCGDGTGGDDAGAEDAATAADGGGAVDAGPGPSDGGALDDAGAAADAGDRADAAAPDAGTAADGGGAVDAGAGADAGSIVCGAGGGGSFPSFDRSCASASDCVAVVHQTDCCGNTRATGIRADEEAAFDEAEATCRAMYPACGCPSGPPVADDGTTGVFGGEAQVECTDEGVCTTTFPEG